MPAAMRVQHCRFRHVLACVCLIVLLGLSLGSFPTFVTAQDDLWHDDRATLPADAPQAELELVMQAPTVDYVDPVGPSEHPREAVAEVSVEVPLDAGAAAQHNVSDMQQGGEDAATAEEQRVIEVTRVPEANEEVEETRRDAQTGRAEDKELQENERMAAEDHNSADKSAAQNAVETQGPFETEMEEGPLSSTVRSATEETDPQSSGSGVFHSADLVQGGALHHGEQSPPLGDSGMETESSSSPGFTILNAHSSTEKVSEQVAEESIRAEPQIAAEVQHADGSPPTEMRRAVEVSQTGEAKQLEEISVAEELQKEEQVREAEETDRQAEEAQKDEERLAEERRKAEEVRLTQERRLDEKAAKRAQEEAQHANIRRRAEEEHQADMAAASAAQRREAVAAAQRRLAAERKEVRAKIDEERVRFQTATADLTAQQEEEELSAALRDRTVLAELQKSMEEKIAALHQDLVALDGASATLGGKARALSLSSTSLTQVQEDVQTLNEEAVKAGETFNKIREAVSGLADAVRASVLNQKDASALTEEKIMLLSKQNMSLKTAHDAAVQQLLARLQELDTQLAEAAEETETEEAAVAAPVEVAVDAATRSVPPVAPATSEALHDVASPPSEPLEPMENSTPAPSPSVPQAEPRVYSPKHAEGSHKGSRREMIETPVKWAEEESYSESGYEAPPREAGAAYKVKRHMEIIGTVVVITIAATVQTLRWCLGGCHSDDEEDDETSGVVTPEFQARETSSASPHKELPQRDGPLQQVPQASPPFALAPRVANPPPDQGGMASPSRLEGGSIAPLSQGGPLPAASEHMWSSTEEGDTLSPAPMPRHHLHGFSPSAPVPGRLGVTGGPSHGTAPLDAARAPPPPGATFPFTPSRNEALGMIPTPMQRQPPPSAGQLGDSSLPLLPTNPPVTGTPPQMHRRRNNGDEFELHNPFLSRWS
ncbi:hypothetical protein, conserved [Leishmania tarentolae]|uniref:Transmembrane protein n=1 Tax=Leishmania tarentolae TaxID=5689 RepID=A0A640KS43_LEITA|nr:hypothetical protein, conserved [Leishmania tarentolae]